MEAPRPAAPLDARLAESGSEETEHDAITRRITEDGNERASGPLPTGPQPIVGDRYIIRELIARGGMGEVHLAWDRQLQREVALKTLRVDLDDETLAPRFVFEARLSGQLEHPNIVPVHDFGTSPDGRPFYTMRWIRGRSLSQLVADGKLPSAVERLDVFRKICDAIAFAHAQGVLHRDLKPNNVMVGEFGEVMVLDWGIARVAGPAGEGSERVAGAERLSDEMHESPHTRAGVVVGTPVFMAPEVLGGQRDGLDARIDVYALGVMLYKLLTDVLPFSGANALRDARSGRFTPPRRRHHDVDRELDAIVCKAMARDPAERYASAEGLRRDVQAYLEGGDIVAYPRSWLGRAARWARHNRRIVAPVITTVVLAGFALVVSGVLYTRALGVSRDKAVVAERVAQVQAARAETAAALTWIEAGRFDEARTALQRSRSALAPDEDTAFIDVTEAYLLHEWAPPVLSWTLEADAGLEFNFALSSDGAELAFITPDRRIRVVRLPEGSITVDHVFGDTEPTTFGFVAGRPVIATAAAGRAAVFDLLDRREILDFTGTAPQIARIHANGRFIEVRDGTARHHLDSVTGIATPLPLPEDATLETITSDGRLVSGHRAPLNRMPDTHFVWDATTGAVLHRFAGLRRLVLDPTGRWMFVTHKTASELRSVESGATLHAWPGLEPRNVVFPADGSEVVIDHADGQLSIWSLPGMKRLAQQRFRANLSGVTNDGDLVVYDSRSWAILAGSPPSAGRFALDGEMILSASSADGQLVCIATKDGRVRIVEPWTGAVLRTFHGAPAPNGSRGCAFSPKTTRLAQADRDGVLRIWSLDDGTKLREIPGNELVYAARFLDENRVLASWVGGAVGIWDIATGEQLTSFEGAPKGPWGLDLSRDGRWVVAGGRTKGDAIATVWPVDGGAPQLRIDESVIGYGAALSPDGRMVAVGTHPGLATWWSIETGARIEAETRNNGAVISVAFSDDGALVFSSSELGSLHVWRAADGREVASIPLFRNDLEQITPLIGTRTLMTQGGDDEVRLFDLDRPRIVAASTPMQTADGFAIPAPGERALQLARLASMRGDWEGAARFFAQAAEGGATSGRIEWARAAWAAGDRAQARRLLAEGTYAGEILAGSAQLWSHAE